MKTIFNSIKKFYYIKNKQSFIFHILITLSIILSFILTFWGIFNNYIIFKGDQGVHLFILQQALAVHKIPLYGAPSSLSSANTGFLFFPPFYWYILLPGYILSHGNPISAPLTQIIIFFASLPFLYIAIKKLVNQNSAYILMLIYPLSNYLMLINRTEWSSNITHSMFSFLLFSIAMLKEKKYLYLLLFSFITATIWQLDFVGVFLIPFAFFSLWVIRDSLKKIDRKYIFWSIITTLISISPTIYLELKYHFPNTRTILSFLFKSHSSIPFSLHLSSYFQNLYYIIGWLYDVPLLLGLILFIVSLLYLIYKYGLKKEKGLLIIISYCISAFLLPIIFPGLIYVHYFFIAILAPFITVSIVLSDIWRMTYISKGIVVLSIAIFIILNLQNLPYTNQLNQMLKEGQKIKDIYGNKPVDIVYDPFYYHYVGPGMDYVLYYTKVNVDKNSTNKYYINRDISYTLSSPDTPQF